MRTLRPILSSSCSLPVAAMLGVFGASACGSADDPDSVVNQVDSVSQAATAGDELTGYLHVHVEGRYADGAQGAPPLGLHLYTPATTKFGTTYPAVTQGLGRTSSSGSCTSASPCVVRFDAMDTSPSDVPFLKHPDQWDNLQIYLSSSDSTRSFVVSEIQISYHSVGPWGLAGTYDFVMTSKNGVAFERDRSTASAGDPLHHPGGWLEPAIERMNATPFEIAAFTLNPATQNKVSLATAIQGKRAATAQALTGIAYSALPTLLKEGTKDLGQSGSLKYSQGRGGGCSATQCYYEYNFTNTAEYAEDFPRWAQRDAATGERYCAQDDSGGAGPWPYPDGQLYTWDVQDRRLAWVNFDGAKLATVPFTRVQRVCSGGVCDWSSMGTSYPYTPKVGDMLYRMDRCWHGGGSSRHAMILLGTPRFVGTDFRVNVLEGSAMTVFFDRSEPWWDVKLPICANGSACDLGEFSDGETNRTYMIIDTNADGDEDVRCPTDANHNLLQGQRYYYLIGERV